MFIILNANISSMTSVYSITHQYKVLDMNMFRSYNNNITSKNNEHIFYMKIMDIFYFIFYYI